MKVMLAAVLVCGVIAAAAPVVLESVRSTEAKRTGDNVRLGTAEK